MLVAGAAVTDIVLTCDDMRGLVAATYTVRSVPTAGRPSLPAYPAAGSPLLPGPRLLGDGKPCPPGQWAALSPVKADVNPAKKTGAARRA
jgi:hypothetical protein